MVKKRHLIHNTPNFKEPLGKALGLAEDGKNTRVVLPENFAKIFGQKLFCIERLISNVVYFVNILRVQ
jgi:hypothetical protein